MYGLIATAKMNDIDPQAGLADVLARIADMPRRRKFERLPWNWNQKNAALAAAAAYPLSSVNKAHHVTTIARVAAQIGEDEDRLWDVATEMNQEDGLMWVYGPGDGGLTAFTDFGIETLIEIHKADPVRLRRSSNLDSRGRGLHRMLTSGGT